jgi:hypothetical protein
MPIRRPTVVVLAAVACALAGAASAQTAPSAALSLAPFRAAIAQVSEPPSIDLSSSPTARNYAQITAMRAAGVAQTSVDHRFTSKGDGGLVGSVGFLCGLQPGQTDKGGAAAYGYDPQGRFVGAKLHIAF